MMLKSPCRLGERFTCEKPFNSGTYFLVGFSFYIWSLPGISSSTLCGKTCLDSKYPSFFEPGDAKEGVGIDFYVPDRFMLPGCPLQDMGIDSDKVGRAAGLSLRADGTWTWDIQMGNDYGGDHFIMAAPALDKFFSPVLPGGEGQDCGEE